MFDTSSNNPPIPSFLRIVTLVECIVVFVTAAVLFFFPDLAANIWAWKIPPFNSRFVGAVYFAAFVPLFIFWYSARWTPGRFVLWMIFIFTGLIMLAMFIHWDAFLWDRPATFLGFWPLYIFLPVNSAIFLYLSRGALNPGTTNLSPAWQMGLKVYALITGLYGLGLLFLPELLTRFWPWHVDAFHGRIYASAFITPALAAWILTRRKGSTSEYYVFGLNLLIGGVMPILGTLWANLPVAVDRQIHYDLGTWIFLFFFVLTALIGIMQIQFASSKLSS